MKQKGDGLGQLAICEWARGAPRTQTRETEMTGKLHDVFISHASEDKDEFVRELANSLRSNHLDVWYDEFSLQIGDSLRESIDRGLASSRFGIVVISPDFIRKPWPVRELNGLVAITTDANSNSILPIWHKVGKTEVLAFSLTLADVVAANSSMGVDVLVEQLVQRIRPDESPLVVARNLLLAIGVETPVISDDWWLDIVEQKEALFRFPDSNLDIHWMFPLPHETESNPRDRGENIAWTALQLDWMNDANEKRLSQLTHPEKVHDFLRQWPGLSDYASRNPGTLALYAPQLTIPGFDEGLVDAFDSLLDPKNPDGYLSSWLGNPTKSKDGNLPLCGELIAWRHGTLGNYSNEALSDVFVVAEYRRFYRNPHGGVTCLAWLLSDDSEWMPQVLKAALLKGFLEKTFHWSFRLLSAFPNNDFSKALYLKPPSRFALTRSVVAGLQDIFRHSVDELQLETKPEDLASRFVENGFIYAFHEENKRRRH